MPVERPFRETLRQDFGKAAAQSYDRHARLQKEVASRVLEAAATIAPDSSVLDLGCGTGYLAAIGEERRRDWRMLQVDLAEAMCRAAARYAPALCADACQLPLADARFDAVVSSLCLQWVPSPQRFLEECSRVLRPNGALIVATLGPGSLPELRQAARTACVQLNLADYPARKEIRRLAERSGFANVSVRSIKIRLVYPNALSFLKHFAAIGAQPKRLSPLSTAATRRLLRHYPQIEQGVTASYEILLLEARKSDQGLPGFGGNGSVIPMPPILPQ